MRACSILTSGLPTFAQAAFIYGGASVKDNILFGLPFDEERYNRAIQVSSLVTDLLQMPGATPDCTVRNSLLLNIRGERRLTWKYQSVIWLRS